MTWFLATGQIHMIQKVYFFLRVFICCFLRILQKYVREKKKKLFFPPYAAFPLGHFRQHKMSEHGKYFLKFKLNKRSKRTLINFPLISILSLWNHFTFFVSNKGNIYMQFITKLLEWSLFTTFSGTIKREFVSSVMSNCECWLQCWRGLQFCLLVTKFRHLGLC